MRLKSFKVENYRSVTDTGWVELSPRDNVSVFAGQNESGKSSILRALKDYEAGTFDETSSPFVITATPVQAVHCIYQVEPSDNFFDQLNENVMDELGITEEEASVVLDRAKIDRIREFTLTRKKAEGTPEELILDNANFQILKSALLKKTTAVELSETEQPASEPKAEAPNEPKAEETNPITASLAASIFWSCTPKIIFFDDFCDLLPDKILISDLKAKDHKVKGYKAVRNLEKILKTDFTKKDSEQDPIRRTKESSENTTLSVDFQEDWGQRIHDENKVNIIYNYEKRNGADAEGSYVNFFVETKEGQLLPPKQRSKGLIWFLSLWLELKAQGKNLVLLLDEPDQHLHVKAQKDILKLINKLGSDHNQIVYATHSPYLIETERLNRVKLIVNLKDEGTLVEDVTTSKIDSVNKKDALQPIADAIGLSMGEFSPLNPKNVLVEGLSDFYYFLAMKKILKNKSDYSIIPGVGLRKVNGLISLCVGYGLEWVVVMDDDPKVGGKDTLNKYEEIKEFVFNGDEVEMKKKVHVLSGVAGIENMFDFEDLKLVDPKVIDKPNKCEVVGVHRKIIFAKQFFEMVNSGHIKEASLSKNAKANFTKAFDFCNKALK